MSRRNEHDGDSADPLRSSGGLLPRVGSNVVLPSSSGCRAEFPVLEVAEPVRGVDPHLAVQTVDRRPGVDRVAWNRNDDCLCAGGITASPTQCGHLTIGRRPSHPEAAVLAMARTSSRGPSLPRQVQVAVIAAAL